MGWIVIALGITQIVGYGAIYYAFPLLVPDAARDLGTTEPVLYAIFSAAILASGLVAPRTGALVDRFGAPAVMSAGSLAAAVLSVAVAVSPNLWAWGAAIVLLQVASLIVQYDAAFAALVRFRGGQARREITRLTLIAGFASTLFWPLTEWLQVWIGWRGAMLVFAGFHLGPCLGLHLWLVRVDRDWQRNPRPPGPPAPGFAPVPPERVRATFLALGASFAGVGAVMSGMGVHLVPTLAAMGHGQGALLGMLVGPAQVAVRLVDAAFWKGVHPVMVAIVSTVALTLSVVLLLVAPVGVATGAAFALIFGAGQGLTSIVRGALPLALFGPQGYGRRLGQLALLRTLASAAAPVGFSLAVAAGGYPLALSTVIIAGIGAILPLVWLRRMLAQEGRLAAV